MELFETLESRQLRDATSAFVINGTSGNDVITVNYDPPPVLIQVKAMTRFRFGGLKGTGTGRTEITKNGVMTVAYIPMNQRIVINGLDGNDTIKVLGAHPVDMRGDKGDDTMTGGAGNDTVWGYWGQDVLRGGPGNDTLIGEEGNDNLQGDAGADLLSGGWGTDTADYASRTTPLSINVDGLPGDGNAGESDNVGLDMEIIECGSGNDFVTAAGALEWGTQIYGNLGNDTLEGSDGPDYIEGGKGSDALFGLGGKDIIAGHWCWASRHAAPTTDDTGTNFIRGGAGSDSLYSGSRLGRDTVCGDEGDDFLFGDRNDILDGGSGDDDIITP
jgi:Ca2+-binding RTX toxin-like protein